MSSRPAALAALEQLLDRIYDDAEAKCEKSLVDRGFSRSAVRDMLAEHRDNTEGDRDQTMADVERAMNETLGDPAKVH